ncbi:MAG: energy transducer TonB [Terracidiphilus sp.]
MSPHRGSPRVPWLAFFVCMTVLALDPTAFSQNPAQPAQPDQQPATPAQPAQQTTPAPSDSQQSTPAQPATPAAAPSPAPPAAAPESKPAMTAQQNSGSEATGDQQGGGITEEELKQMLVGKTFYLRGGYLDDSLSFNEHGKLAGHSPVGSYTLNMVEIAKVHLSKHKVELEGLRYGLHFSNQLAFEDPRTAYDKVRITPKKKLLRITIDRESVVKPKKVKEKNKRQQAKPAAAAAATGTQAPAAQPASAAAGQPAESAEEPDTEQARAEIAAAKPEERPADPDSVTSTTSPAHATMVLKQALDAIFAPGLDDRMMAAMPDFWKLYYKAVAEKSDYRPADSAVLRQSTVDKKARLLTNFEPDSNEFAQNNGVAGMALYHTVIGPDGIPGEIAVARPIGFGLDENAVKAIRAAKFEPAEKDGKPVPVLLDLVVQFRIYSKRTNVTEPHEDAAKPAEPVLPGPYSAHKTQ